MYFAAQEGRLDCLKYFIEELKCDPISQDNEGMTLLHAATQEGHFEMVQVSSHVVWSTVVRPPLSIYPNHQCECPTSQNTLILRPLLFLTDPASSTLVPHPLFSTLVPHSWFLNPGSSSLVLNPGSSFLVPQPRFLIPCSQPWFLNPGSSFLVPHPLSSTLVPHPLSSTLVPQSLPSFPR